MVNVATSAPNGAVDKAKVADWDGDGRTDLITSVGGSYYVSRSTGNDFFTAASLGIPDNATVTDVKLGDIDGDGLTDWVYRNSATGRIMFRLHLGKRADLATAFTDGFGITAQPTYTSIAQGSYARGSGASFPYQDYQGPLYVVSSLVASSGNGGTYVRTYNYEGARIHLQGRGFMGFALKRTHDSRDGLYRREYFSQQFPFAGLLAQQEVRQSNDETLIEKTVNTLQKLDVGSGDQTASFPYVGTAVTDTNELNGAAVSKQTTTMVADNYGSPTTRTVSRQDMDSGSPWFGETFQVQTVNTITNNTGTWCLGRPHRSTVTSTLPNVSPLTRTTAATIDYAGCRVTGQTLEPDSSTLAVATTYGFDSCGNITSEAVVGKMPDGTNMPTRTTVRSFGARCQLPEVVTNPLGQSGTISYDYSLGVPETSTDPNGLQVSQTHDGFGRPDVATRPDGTDTAISLVACGSLGSYCDTYMPDVRWLQITRQRDTGDAVIRTETVAYDAFDRPRYKTVDLPGSATSIVRWAYDSLGRVDRVYMPMTTAPAGYRSLGYDVLGRVTTDSLYTASNQLDRQTTSAYAGRKTSTTDPLGHTTARYTDVTGKLRRVEEPSPGGTANYSYDPFGQLRSVTDAGNAVTTWTYNVNGALTSLSHPDRGNWVYTSNSLGEVLSQTNAKAQTLTMTYDQLSRPLTRVEPEGTTTWTWGTSAVAHEIGRLSTLSGPGYAEAYAYDAKGRLAQTQINADTTYDINYDYSATTGLPESLTYPTSTSGYRLRIRYDYDQGVLSRVSDYNAPQTVFWQLNAVDARGNALDESLGTASPVISVISGYDPLTGLIDYRTAGTGAPYTNRQNLSFAWDKNGNLKTRLDANQANLTEEFFYDPLDRLDYAQRNGVTTLDLAYVANGNIATRAEGGMFYTYGYGAKPHAVMQVQYACDCTCLTDDYGYDANGNMTSRLGSSLSWYSYDLPNSLTQGSSYSSQFAYTPDRRRWQQVATYGAITETTIYLGGILEKVTRGGVTEYKHYIPAGRSSTALHTRRSNGTSATYYLTRDHLGSGTAVMDANGASLANLSFGALGSRRGAAWQDVPSTDDWTQITATTRRGFTGHEHLDNLSLIHMNGRAYDPKLGRFLSGDPVYVGNPADPQSLNPYSYAGNRPLSATDPTGFAAIGSLSETTVSAEFGLLGQLANLDQAISQYQAALGTWAAGCRAALGSCNDVAPEVSGILGAASGVVSAGNALQRLITNGELAREQQKSAQQEAWLEQIQQQKKDLERSKLAALWSGDYDTWMSLVTRYDTGLGDAAVWGAKVLGTDIFAFAFGNTVGKAMTFGWDVGKAIGAIGSLNPLATGWALLSTAVHLGFPNYGFYGGAGYGTTQFGAIGGPPPLNRLDYSNLYHDRSFDHGGWVRDVWSSSTPGIAAGPLGLLYQSIGTPIFLIGDALGFSKP